MVTPDRETPGWRAIAWANPSPSPVLGVIESRPRSLAATLSTHHRATPNTTSITPINHGCPRVSEMNPSNAAPP